MAVRPHCCTHGVCVAQSSSQGSTGITPLLASPSSYPCTQAEGQRLMLLLPSQTQPKGIPP